MSNSPPQRHSSCKAAERADFISHTDELVGRYKAALQEAADKGLSTTELEQMITELEKTVDIGLRFFEAMSNKNAKT